MAKLGELLVAAGLLTAEQVEQALRAQVMWGGRLGTNLIELGCIDLDALTKVLGRQHQQPAVLARHFERADRDLQRRLSAAVAEKLECVPVMKVGDNVVVASVSPLSPRAIAIVAGELGLAAGAHIVPGIAAELRIRYQLERAYQIPRSARFLRSRGEQAPPAFPAIRIEAVSDLSEPALALPVDEPASPAPPPPEPPSDFETITDVVGRPIEEEPEAPARDKEESGRKKRRYLRTIADEPSGDSERTLGRIAIRRVAVAASATLGDAARAIRRSTDRDKVAELIVDALDRFVPACEAAVLLVIRGDVAIGWKGYSRAGAPLPEVVVPLDVDGLVARAISKNGALREPAAALDPIDQLLLVSLGCAQGDLVAVPVAIAGQVVCAFAIVTAPDASRSENLLVPTAELLAAAAGAAFARLMRDASR